MDSEFVNGRCNSPNVPAWCVAMNGSEAAQSCSLEPLSRAESNHWTERWFHHGSKTTNRDCMHRRVQNVGHSGQELCQECGRGHHALAHSVAHRSHPTERSVRPVALDQPAQHSRVILPRHARRKDDRDRERSPQSLPGSTTCSFRLPHDDKLHVTGERRERESSIDEETPSERHRRRTWMRLLSISV